MWLFFKTPSIVLAQAPVSTTLKTQRNSTFLALECLRVCFARFDSEVTKVGRWQSHTGWHCRRLLGARPRPLGRHDLHWHFAFDSSTTARFQSDLDDRECSQEPRTVRIVSTMHCAPPRPSLDAGLFSRTCARTRRRPRPAPRASPETR